MVARIMVVDDTQEILELFREILEDEGYEVHLHAFAVRDLAEIERVAPDLLILDFIMTDERSGWQLLQKLKMRPATAALPVVACTGALRQVEELEGHLKAMGVEVVLKPFHIEGLLGAVRRALATRGAPQDEGRAPA